MIVKGGLFDGDFYNLQGSTQILGCVEIVDTEEVDVVLLLSKGV